VSVDQVVATNQDELRELTGWVHDAWFDVDDLEFATKQAEVRLPLFHGAKRRGRFGFVRRSRRIGRLTRRAAHT
jgi:hypothetical protein